MTIIDDDDHKWAIEQALDELLEMSLEDAQENESGCGGYGREQSIWLCPRLVVDAMRMAVRLSHT